MVHSGGAGDKVAEGVAEDDGRPVGEGVDHRRDVARHVVEAHTGDRAHRAGDPARLGAQHPVAGIHECVAEGIGVLTAVPAVGRDDDHGRALAVDIGLDGRGAGGDRFAAPVHDSAA
jgi:hypothetical protein